MYYIVAEKMAKGKLELPVGGMFINFEVTKLFGRTLPSSSSKLCVTSKLLTCINITPTCSLCLPIALSPQNATL